MARIRIAEDCGNAPKKQYVRDFLVSWANGDVDEAVEMLTDDVVIDRPGSDPIEGHDEAKALISAAPDRPGLSTMSIENLISHGDRCAANGLLEFEGGRSVAFCAMFAFDGHGKRAKVKSITSYLIETG